MRFIGQKHIIRQLDFILPSIKSGRTSGANILLKGPSGFGKTSLALKICNYFGGVFQIFNGEDKPFVFNRKVVFIDEIHTVKELERFYHIMDAKAFVFIFASNKDGNLPEAFINRCYEFIFTDYSQEELELIAYENCEFPVEDSELTEIVKAGASNPRIIKSIISRLNIYFREHPKPESMSNLLEEVFNIRDGLDTLAIRYLQTLESCSGRASLSTLRSLLHVDESTLTQQVEPVLLSKRLITITSRGRSLVDNASINYSL